MKTSFEFKKSDWKALAIRWSCTVSLVVAASAIMGDRIMAEPSGSEAKTEANSNLEEATFGGGCFWCTEAVFQQLKGVKKVVSGYSNGTTKNPTYEQVCTGLTGHAEVIRITFDPKQVSYQELLEVFFKTHDPTTLNRQGADRGTQYRSAVFYHSESQRDVASKYKLKLNSSQEYSSPIVTEITQIKSFYPAEDYHQNYFRTHPEQGYCKAVIKGKVDKFKAAYKDKLQDAP